MRARREALVEECCTSDSNRGSLSPSFFTVFCFFLFVCFFVFLFFFSHLKLLLLSQPVNNLPIFPGSAQTHSPMKSSWIYLSFCWVPKALFTPLVKDPSYPTPSFIHMQTAFLSSWGIRSVHQALCWIILLIISKPHNKLYRKYWPHFTDEETEIK